MLAITSLLLLCMHVDRFQHLVTQMNWRLNEGHGHAFYELGVSDSGNVIGMSSAELDTSMHTLFRMCQVLGADMHVSVLRDGIKPTWKAARVAISRIADDTHYETQAKKQVRGMQNASILFR
jgi:GTPase